MDYEKKIDISFGASDSDGYYEEIVIPEGFTAIIEDGKVIIKKEESEDEKIRKELVEYFRWNAQILNDIDNREVIAWLEKRKDYVSPQMVADAYLRGCNDTEKKWLEKQGQAFPILSNSSKTGKKWTEEDEVFLKDTIACVDFVYKNYSTHKEFYKNLSNNTIDILKWLNSLKKKVINEFRRNNNETKRKSKSLRQGY